DCGGSSDGKLANSPGGGDSYIILLPEGADKADAGLPPTIVMPTVPIAIIRSIVVPTFPVAIIRWIVVPTVPVAIIRSIVMSGVAIAIIGSIAVPPIIDFLHLASTVALGKRQNAGLRGRGPGCVDHHDDDKRES